MYCLTVNSGSSSVKFDIFTIETAQKIISGSQDRLDEYSETERNNLCTKLINQLATDAQINYDDISLVIHRVVHGGSAYSTPTLVTRRVKTDIQKLSQFAPLHNPHNLSGIYLCEKLFLKAQQVAVFDTAYHATIPEVNSLYGIPYQLAHKYEIKRYGFHGISHAYLNRRIAQEIYQPNLAVVSCHLGGGSSVAASLNGRSLACSMGFTPLEGVPMGTRSGSIDPAIVIYMQETLGMSLEEVKSTLWQNSGILGVSEISSDMRDLLFPTTTSNAQRISLTLNWYTQSIAEEIAKMATKLPHLDAIAFTGGIGQHSDIIRKMILQKLWMLPLTIDQQKNTTSNFRFEATDSEIALFAIPAEESLEMFLQTQATINQV